MFANIIDQRMSQLANDDLKLVGYKGTWDCFQSGVQIPEPDFMDRQDSSFDCDSVRYLESPSARLINYRVLAQENPKLTVGYSTEFQTDIYTSHSGPNCGYLELQLYPKDRKIEVTCMGEGKNLLILDQVRELPINQEKNTVLSIGKTFAFDINNAQTGLVMCCSEGFPSFRIIMHGNGFISIMGITGYSGGVLGMIEPYELSRGNPLSIVM